MIIRVPADDESAPGRYLYEGPARDAHKHLPPGEYDVAEDSAYLLLVKSTASLLVQTVVNDRRTDPGDTMQVEMPRPVARGRETRTLETLAVVERLAARVHHVLDSDVPIVQSPLMRSIRRTLADLITEANIRLTAEAKYEDDRAAIREAAVLRLRVLEAEAGPVAEVEPVKFSWVPEGFAVHPATTSYQVLIATPAGAAVATALSDGTFEIETSFGPIETKLYYDTLSADAAMARVYGLATAWTAEHDA